MRQNAVGKKRSYRNCRFAVMNTFVNNPVDIGLLPKAESLTLQPIEPAYKKVLLWEWMLRWGIITGIVIVIVFFIPALHSFLWIAVITGIVLILSILNLWLLYKSFAQKAYALRDRDLVYRSGWIIQRFSVCPFNRIQHCSVNAGPLERRLGLSSLSVYTAGTEGSDIKIPGLQETTAFALRDFIMKKTATDEQP